MAPSSKLSGQNCNLLKVSFASLLRNSLEYKENESKYRSLTCKLLSRDRILVYQKRPFENWKQGDPIQGSHIKTSLMIRLQA